jgi:hypothetical protein
MKKLLVILGAGSSLEVGMPSVTEIDKLFDDWASDSYSLNSDKSRNLYRWVKEKVQEYYSSNIIKGRIPEQNFETILFTIQTLSTISDNSNEDYKNNKGLKAFIEIKEFPELKRYFNDIITPDSKEFQRLQSDLTDKLLYYIRKKCQTLAIDKQAEILKIRNFFKLLKEDYELGFINLNYDNVILTALPDLSTGYSKDTGEFDKDQFYNDNWNFCYHIHGSVYFDMNNKGIKPHSITWNDNLSSVFETKSSQRNVDFTSEGNYYLNSTIITGLDKANQILREPFRQYYMKIDKLIHESDSILFIGYGFGDLHLNKLFPSHRFNATKKRQVVVVDFFPDDTEAIYKRPDSWSYKLFETIPFNGTEMGNGSIYIPPDTIIDYKKNKTFEFSRNDKYPLSIWYNGFMEACENGEIIKKELLK